VERHNSEGGVWVLPLCRICAWKHNGIFGRYYKAWVPKLVLCELTGTAQIVVEALGERDLRAAHLSTVLQVVAGFTSGRRAVTQITRIEPTGHRYLKDGPGHKVCVLDFPSSVLDFPSCRLIPPVAASLHFVYAGDGGTCALRGERSRIATSQKLAREDSRLTAGAWRCMSRRLPLLLAHRPLASPDLPPPWLAGTDYECTELLQLSAGLDARSFVLRASAASPAGTFAQPSALQHPQPQSPAYFAPRSSALDMPDDAAPMHPSWALPPAVLQRWRQGTWGCLT
jgi:hypothetical protein